MTQSVLTKRQKQKHTKTCVTLKDGTYYCRVEMSIRYDDECGNGYNTFAITGSAWEKGSTRRSDPDVCGCIHEILEEVFPEHAHLIKWHLMNSDAPMHYVANTTYHASNQDFDYARSSAIWPEATDEQLSLPTDELTKLLEARNPDLVISFIADVESTGFKY